MLRDASLADLAAAIGLRWPTSQGIHLYASVSRLIEILPCTLCHSRSTEVESVPMLPGKLHLKLLNHFTNPPAASLCSPCVPLMGLRHG